MRILGMIPLVLLWTYAYAFGACIGSSPQWEAADCSDTEIADCIEKADSGDTITVPPGECTWTSTVTIPSGKTIVLKGSGSDQTKVYGTTKFLNMLADHSRVSGIGFYRTIGGDDTPFVEAKGIGFRIDQNYMHNAAYETQWATCVTATAANETRRPEGVVESNHFDKCKIIVTGSTNLEKDNGFWAAPSVIGTDKAVYFEDNIIDRGNIGSVLSDSNYAGSFVIRFNTLIGGNAMTHSLQARAHRATKSFEYYRNNWTMPTSLFYDIAFLRGGTGMFFDNTVTGPRAGYQISLDNVRSFRTDCCGDNPPPATDDAGACNGTSPWDGNIESNGWPCRDQIGRGPDVNPDNSVIGKANSSAPAYFWNNQHVGVGTVPVVVRNGSDAWIQADRDYYEAAAAFDGSTGVGAGTLADRPATCSQGVGYWATDQGDWNQTDGGAQGVLYQCTNTNTWEVHYTPYTYPHPLRDNNTSTPSPSNSTDGSSSGCFLDTFLNEKRTP